MGTLGKTLNKKKSEIKSLKEQIMTAADDIFCDIDKPPGLVQHALLMHIMHF